MLEQQVALPQRPLNAPQVWASGIEPDSLFQMRDSRVWLALEKEYLAELLQGQLVIAIEGDRYFHFNLRFA